MRFGFYSTTAMVLITKIGTGLKVSTALKTTFFSNPSIAAAPTSKGVSYPDGRINLLEISQGKTSVVLPIADITTIGGNAPAGTLTAVIDQLLAL